MFDYTVEKTSLSFSLSAVEGGQMQSCFDFAQHEVSFLFVFFGNIGHS